MAKGGSKQILFDFQAKSSLEIERKIIREMETRRREQGGYRRWLWKMKDDLGEDFQ